MSRTILRRSTSGLLAATLVLGACSGDDAADSAASTPVATDTATSDPAAAPETSLVLAPGQVLHHVGVRFQYGGMIVTIGDLVHDPGASRAWLGVRYQNIGRSWHMTAPTSTLVVGDVELPGLGDVADLPPGMSLDTTVEFDGVPADPMDAGAVLRWGRPDLATPTVDLATGTVTSGSLPTTLPLDGWARIGRYGVHVIGAIALSGMPELDAAPPAGERVLRVLFDLYAAVQDPVNGFLPSEHLTLRRPDGQVVTAGESSDGVFPVSWTTSTAHWIDFPVTDPLTGDYELLLNSISPTAMGTFFPDLIEHVALPFHLDDPAPAPEGEQPAPPVPVVPELDPTTGVELPTEVGAPFDVALDVGSMNVPGFLVRPTRLVADPAAQSALLTVDVTSIGPPAVPDLPVAADPTGTDPAAAADAAGDLLDLDPIFSFTQALTSGGRVYTGVLDGDGVVPLGETRTFTIEFLSVTDLSAADAGLMIGPRGSFASTLPLGPESGLPVYPPAPVAQPITAEPVVAGDWTVQLRSYRVGLLGTGATTTPAGMRDLEITLDATLAPTAQPKALGLWFRGAVQLFLASPDGYLVQAAEDHRLVPYQPGDTQPAVVTFRVPESFEPGTYRFVLRSTDETTDVTAEGWIETSFSVTLGTITTPEVDG